MRDEFNARVTTWNYDAERGWLTNKVYDDGKGTKYFYSAAGRLSTRLWARGTNTTYTYNCPFGEVIRCSGAAAKSNPFGFSTKFQDYESDMLYYGYRYLRSSTGRWLSRDLIEEQGGLGLYTFLANNCQNSYDALGLAEDPPPRVINGGKEMYYDITPKWFEHPADEGKPCCCDSPAKLTKFAKG